MNYLIRLISKQPQHLQTQAVCGISTKVYGHAAYDASQGGYVFEMKAEDYERDRHDIVGNPAPGQHWVPQFAAGNIFTFGGHTLEIANHGLDVLFDGIRISMEAIDDIKKPTPEGQWFRSLGEKDGQLYFESRILAGESTRPITSTDPATPAPETPVDNKLIVQTFLASCPINAIRAIAKSNGISVKNTGKQKLIDLLVEKMQGPPA